MSSQHYVFPKVGPLAPPQVYTHLPQSTTRNSVSSLCQINYAAPLIYDPENLGAVTTTAWVFHGGKMFNWLCYLVYFSYLVIASISVYKEDCYEWR